MKVLCGVGVVLMLAVGARADDLERKMVVGEYVRSPIGFNAAVVCQMADSATTETAAIPIIRYARRMAVMVEDGVALSEQPMTLYADEGFRGFLVGAARSLIRTRAEAWDRERRALEAQINGGAAP